MTKLALMVILVLTQWLKITFLEPKEAVKVLNQNKLGIWRTSDDKNLTRKKGYTTSMPSTEACFLQWAHPGETEDTSCGDDTVLWKSMKYSYFYISTCSVSFWTVRLIWIRRHGLSSFYPLSFLFFGSFCVFYIFCLLSQFFSSLLFFGQTFSLWASKVMNSIPGIKSRDS